MKIVSIEFLRSQKQISDEEKRHLTRLEIVDEEGLEAALEEEKENRGEREKLTMFSLEEGWDGRVGDERTILRLR